MKIVRAAEKQKESWLDPVSGPTTRKALREDPSYRAKMQARDDAREAKSSKGAAS